MIIDQKKSVKPKQGNRNSMAWSQCRWRRRGGEKMTKYKILMPYIIFQMHFYGPKPKKVCWYSLTAGMQPRENKKKRLKKKKLTMRSWQFSSNDNTIHNAFNENKIFGPRATEHKAKEKETERHTYREILYRQKKLNLQ